MGTTNVGTDELPEPTPADERAAEVLEDEGGLPADNPFTDVVEQMRESEVPWTEIASTMDEIYDIVDAVAYEASFEQRHEWTVTVDPLPGDSTVDTNEHTKLAESEEAAREMVDLPGRSEIADVEYNRMVKVG